ncbi:MAG: hypothetical protein GY861_28755 [bacterium]|nr:hypothetical protein [bacterium]
MADQLLTGTTLVEKESRSAGDVAIGGIIEWDDTYTTIPDNFRLCDGGTVTDPTSPYNGNTVPDYNTEYLSIPASNPITQNANISYTGNAAQNTLTAGATLMFLVPINLPNGATITEVLFSGSDATEPYTIKRIGNGASSGSETMATDNLNTASTTITSGTIDNKNYRYFAYIGSLTSTDVYYGGLITYTPRMKFIIRIK